MTLESRAHLVSKRQYIRRYTEEELNSNLLLCCVFQEHPGLRGTPLAMLAAQCNKLSSKSPPPLADAAVGKGFHPWKKSPQGAGGQTTGPGSPTPPQSRNPTSTTSTASSMGNSAYSSRPVMTSCGMGSGYTGSDFYFPGATTQAAENSHHQAALLGKVEGAATHHATLGQFSSLPRNRIVPRLTATYHRSTTLNLCTIAKLIMKHI